MNRRKRAHVFKPLKELSSRRSTVIVISVVLVAVFIWTILIPHFEPTSSNIITAAEGSQLTSSCTVAPKEINDQRLVFDDEFGCDTTLNPAVWQSNWFGEDGSMNNVHTYSSNVFLSGGYLNLKLASSTSGALVTTAPNGPSDPGFKFTFGTIVWRANIPYIGTQVVNWPALWTAGVPNKPSGGEIDIAEGLSGSMCFLVHNLQGAWTGSCNSGVYPGWHTFSMTWALDNVTFTYDNKVVGIVKQYVTSLPMYIVMNNGWSNVDTPTFTPTTMDIQYVRVYQ